MPKGVGAVSGIIIDAPHGVESPLAAVLTLPSERAFLNPSQILLDQLEQVNNERVAAVEAAQARLDREAQIEKARIALTERLRTARIQPNSFYFGNCTYLVAGILAVPWRGNANRWDNNARAMGYVVDSVPSIGAIAQTDRGRWGHVALTLKVDGDQILAREMNYEEFNVDSERWVDKSEFVYIHVPL